MVFRVPPRYHQRGKITALHPPETAVWWRRGLAFSSRHTLSPSFAFWKETIGRLQIIHGETNCRVYLTHISVVCACMCVFVLVFEEGSGSRKLKLISIGLCYFLSIFSTCKWHLYFISVLTSWHLPIFSLLFLCRAYVMLILSHAWNKTESEKVLYFLPSLLCFCRILRRLD